MQNHRQMESFVLNMTNVRSACSDVGGVAQTENSRRGGGGG